jgi:FixJ family two-component response regulator
MTATRGIAPVLSPRLGDRFESLTGREREVAAQIVLGASRLEAAKAMGCEPKTYDTHRVYALAKTGARNNAELTRMAIACGFSSMHDSLQEDTE